MNNKRNVNRPGLMGVRIAAFCAFMIGSTGLAMGAVPDALYQWDFENGGTNTGTASGGNLSINNGVGGTVSFSGGVLDLTGNNRSNASVSGHAFSSLGNVGTLSQFSISMRVDPTLISGYQEFFVLGSSSTDNFGANNAIALRFSSSGLEVRVGTSNGSSYASVTPVSPITAGEMTFITLTYDGTSELTAESAVQEAATGESGSGAYNMQVYIGSGDELTRTGVRWGTVASQTFNKGSVVLGEDASIILGARSNNDRALNGVMDDVLVFDQVLTQTEVNELYTIPEPTTTSMALGMGVLLVCLVLRRKRS